MTRSAIACDPELVAKLSEIKAEFATYRAGTEAFTQKWADRIAWLESECRINDAMYVLFGRLEDASKEVLGWAYAVSHPADRPPEMTAALNTLRDLLLQPCRRPLPAATVLETSR